MKRPQPLPPPLPRPGDSRFDVRRRLTTAAWRPVAVVRGGPRLRFYGGKLCENMIQAMARDVFAEGLLRVEAAGFNPILTVHDEVVCELPGAKAEAALPEIIRLMTVPPVWAPDLPLAAEGEVASHYRK